jgi:hypothetical protein
LRNIGKLLEAEKKRLILAEQCGHGTSSCSASIQTLHAQSPVFKHVCTCSRRQCNPSTKEASKPEMICANRTNGAIAIYSTMSSCHVSWPKPAHQVPCWFCSALMFMPDICLNERPSPVESRRTAGVTIYGEISKALVLLEKQRNTMRTRLVLSIGGEESQVGPTPASFQIDRSKVCSLAARGVEKHFSKMGWREQEPSVASCLLVSITRF